MNSPIICAGFHRSGMSLASQLLHLSGVPFALESMPGNISNPDGHFEDMVAMRMHDEFLSESGSNWQFHDESKVDHNPSVVERIKRYCDCRHQLDGPLWLMKDPRATLYLDDWQSALEGNGKFVLMYRHWGLCIQSLLKRHSQILAYSLPTGLAMSTDIAFWQSPELAVRMWLAYNKAMIKFIQANKENCLVVSQLSLMQGYDLIAAINNRFEEKLKPISVSPVSAEYASESVDVVVLNGLSSQLQLELNETYRQLEQLCNIGSTGTRPEFIESPVNDKAKSLIFDRMKMADRIKANKIEEEMAVPLQQLSQGYHKLNFDELLLKLKNLQPLVNRTRAKASLEFSLRLIELRPFSIVGHEWAGKIYSNLGQYRNAEIHFVKAISIGSAPPYMKMLLANTYVARFKFDLAEYFYLLAFKENSKNPFFSVKLGDLYCLTKKYDKAIESYEAALLLKDDNLVRGKLIDTIVECRGAKAAIEFTNTCLEKNNTVPIRNKLITLKLKLRTADAKDKYRDFVKGTINKEKVSIFFENLYSLSLPDKQLQHLSYWFSVHYDELYTDFELHELTKSQESGVVTGNRLICTGMITNDLSRLAKILSHTKIKSSVSSSCQYLPLVKSFSVPRSGNRLAVLPASHSFADVQKIENLKIDCGNMKSETGIQRFDEILIDNDLSNTIDATLPPNIEASYLFTIGHWSEYFQYYYQSLAQLIAEELPVGEDLNLAIEAWQSPQVLAGAWLKYHRALLRFYKAQPERCFVILDVELNNVNLTVPKLNDYFSLGLSYHSNGKEKTITKLPFDKPILSSIPESLKSQLNDVYEAMLALSNCKEVGGTNTDVSSVSTGIERSGIPGHTLPSLSSFSLDRIQGIPGCSGTQVMIGRSATQIEQANKLQNVDEFDYLQTISHLEAIKVPERNRVLDLMAILIRNLERLQPGNWRTQEWLGRVSELNNELDKAETHYCNAISTKMAPPYLYGLLAALYLNQGRTKEAIDRYLNAIEGNSKNPSFPFGLALAYEQLKEYETALQYFRLALTLGTNKVEVELHMIDCLLYLDRIEELKGYALNAWRQHSHLPSGILLSKMSVLKGNGENITGDSVSIADVRERLVQKLPKWLSEFPVTLMESTLKDHFLHSLQSNWCRLGFNPVGRGNEKGFRLHPVLSNMDVESIRPISFVVIRFSDEIDFNFRLSSNIRENGNQIIEVDNTSNLYFNNLSRAILHGMKQAKHEIIAVIHEDVLLADQWQQHFESSLRELEKHDCKWGMLGAVGWKDDGQIFGHWSDPHGYKNTFVNDLNYSQVVKLDEQLLIFNSNRLPDFDPSLPGIHHIGSDLRNMLLGMGYITYVLNAPTIHKYSDRNGSLVFQRKDSIKIQDRQSKTYLADKAVCDDYIQHKWPNIPIPHCNSPEEFPEITASVLKRLQLESPVILISRGGSGSRLCSLLAQDAGIFLGNDIAETGDSLEFVSAVYQGMVAKHHCYTARQQEQIVPRLRQTAMKVLQAIPEDVIWGFKLPESIFLLPELRRAFPKARYIHFLRDPLTTTLRRTHMTARLDNHIGRISLPLAYDYLQRSRKQLLLDSPALHMAYTTIHQLACVDEHVKNISSNNYFEVRYEEVLSDAELQVEKMCRWLGIKQISHVLEESIDIGRSKVSKTIYGDEIRQLVEAALKDVRHQYNYL